MKLLKEGNIDRKWGFYILGLFLILILGLYSFSFVPVHYICYVEGEYIEYYGVSKNIDLLFDTNKVYGPTTVLYENQNIDIDHWIEAVLDDNCVLD